MKSLAKKFLNKVNEGIEYNLTSIKKCRNIIKKSLKSKNPLMNVHLKDYYILEYTSDTNMFNDFNPNATFRDAILSLLPESPKDIYEIIGVDDSAVRERIMGFISENILKIDYDIVYTCWVGRDYERKEDIRL